MTMHWILVIFFVCLSIFTVQTQSSPAVYAVTPGANGVPVLAQVSPPNAGIGGIGGIGDPLMGIVQGVASLATNIFGSFAAVVHGLFNIIAPQQQPVYQ